MNTKINKNLIIESSKTISETLKKIKLNGKGCVIVLNKNKLYGTCTDGDIRSALLKKISLTENVGKICNKKPKKIVNNKNISKNFSKFKKLKLNLVPLVDEKNILKNIFFLDKKIKQKKKQKDRDNTIFITAGGKGSRLYPFTSVLPKPLMPIRGRTAIFQIIKDFYIQGFRNFVITLNYKSSIIKNYLEDVKKFFKNIKITFIIEKKPLGSLGSILNEKNKIKTNFIVTNCDTLTKFKYSNILDYHQKKKSLITIIVLNKKFNLSYGVIKVDKRINGVNEINEKPKIQFLTNSGIYIINPLLLRKIKKKNINFDIIKLTDFCRKNGITVNYFTIKDNHWHDIGTWLNYEKTIKNF